MSFFDSFLEIAGNLGFLVGNNDRRRERARRERARRERRSWGDVQDGYSVSIATNTLEPDPDETLRFELALRNTTLETRELMIGSWLDFFALEIVQPDGFQAGLNAFGKHQLEAARASKRDQVSLPPNAIVEAEIPAGSLYELKQHGVYTVRSRSRAGGAISNALQIRI